MPSSTTSVTCSTFTFVTLFACSLVLHALFATCLLVSCLVPLPETRILFATLLLRTLTFLMIETRPYHHLCYHLWSVYPCCSFPWVCLCHSFLFQFDPHPWKRLHEKAQTQGTWHRSISMLLCHTAQCVHASLHMKSHLELAIEAMFSTDP